MSNLLVCCFAMFSVGPKESTSFSILPCGSPPFQDLSEKPALSFPSHILCISMLYLCVYCIYCAMFENKRAEDCDFIKFYDSNLVNERHIFWFPPKQLTVGGLTQLNRGPFCGMILRLVYPAFEVTSRFHSKKLRRWWVNSPVWNLCRYFFKANMSVTLLDLSIVNHS